jgi:hypothetical protein
MIFVAVFKVFQELQISSQTFKKKKKKKREKQWNCPLWLVLYLLACLKLVEYSKIKINVLLGLFFFFLNKQRYYN